MYRLELMKVCDHVTRSCTGTDSCLSSHILLLAITLHVYYTPIPTTLFISTDNQLVLLEDDHESQSGTKVVAKTREKSPKFVVPQNDNSGRLSQPHSMRQDTLTPAGGGSLTSDKEQSSPVQTGAHEGLFMHAHFFKLLAKLF